MGNRLYVGDLSFDSTAETLRNAFASYGDVADVHVVTDRGTGASRGFAFVTMASAEEARAALSKLDSSPLGGRSLRVSEVEERQARSGKRGGGNSGGGRW